MGRNGQRCIHFITSALTAMSDADFGANRSMAVGQVLAFVDVRAHDGSVAGQLRRKMFGVK